MIRVIDLRTGVVEADKLPLLCATGAEIMAWAQLPSCHDTHRTLQTADRRLLRDWAMAYIAAFPPQIRR